MKMSTARKMDLTAALDTITLLIGKSDKTRTPVRSITECQVESFEQTLKRTFAVLSKAYQLQLTGTKSLRKTAKKNRQIATLISRYVRRFDRLASKAYTAAKYNRLSGVVE